MNQIGLIGLGTMGINLARNFARNGVATAVYNRTTEVAKTFIEEHGNEGPLTAYETLSEFVQSLDVPRKLILMVTAGTATDAVIEQLLPLLEPNDIIIDGGNTNYKDTIARTEKLKPKQIQFIGCGISGGEEGALNGPSIMPGGAKESLYEILPILQKIAAKDFNGNPCIDMFIGIGAGNFIKTLHNGIEYAIMQIHADAYELLRKIYLLEPDQIADIFAKFNDSDQEGFLLSTAVEVLHKDDEFNTSKKLIDYISDQAGVKGTGTWSVEAALEYNVPVPSIANALFARQFSSNDQRKSESEIYQPPKQNPHLELEDFVMKLEKAVWMASVASYMQGIRVIEQASIVNNWDVNISDVVRVWQGGCIIRSKLLNYFPLSKNGKILEVKIPQYLPALSDILHESFRHGLAVPSLSGSFDYIASSLNPKMPTNLVQGVRDNFGAHTYKRTDREGVFHTNWNS